jgi:hypothetical protein
MNEEDREGLEWLLDLLAQSDTGNATAHTLPNGGPPQIKWDDGKYTTSITVFPPGPDTEEVKHFSRYNNDIAWVGNIRFTRTKNL